MEEMTYAVGKGAWRERDEVVDDVDCRRLQNIKFLKIVVAFLILILILITAVLYSAPYRKPTQECSEPRAGKNLRFLKKKI